MNRFELKELSPPRQTLNNLLPLCQDLIGIILVCLQQLASTTFQCSHSHLLRLERLLKIGVRLREPTNGFKGRTQRVGSLECRALDTEPRLNIAGQQRQRLAARPMFC